MIHHFVAHILNLEECFEMQVHLSRALGVLVMLEAPVIFPMDIPKTNRSQVYVSD